MYYDFTYIFVLIGALLCLAASGYLNFTYSKYARMGCSRRMTGAEAAERILQNAGIRDVRIEYIGGELSDHYDPRSKVLRLSDSTYHNDSIAAIGIAAHECGHAIQHHEGYAPLSVRSFMAPAAGIGSNLGIPLVFVGILLGFFQPLIYAGIVLFTAAVLFQLVTLPVEFDASSRAIKNIEQYGLLGNEEIGGCRKVLTAAALTYVAAAAASIMQLLRLILLSERGNNRRSRR